MSSQLEKHIHVTEERNASSDAWHNMTFSYIRLSRLHLFPLGTIFVFWPFAWGILMASTNRGSNPQSILVIAVTTFTFGAIATLLHSAACVLSDICDKDLDSQVERTSNRPLVTGEVSTIGAWIFMICIMAMLLGVLRCIAPQARLYVQFGVIPLSTIYPLTKRWTWWPQLWLGFAINFGIFAAWANAADDSFPVMLPVFVMFAALICWSIFYDTIYAWQDRVDDAKAGVKSTALLFGNYVRPILSVFATTFVSLMWLAGILNGNGVWYFCISCGGAACHLIWQLATWNDADNADCAAKFASNGSLGLIVWMGLVADYVARLGALYY